jgi:hypothetical protein
MRNLRKIDLVVSDGSKVIEPNKIQVDQAIRPVNARLSNDDLRIASFPVSRQC